MATLAAALDALSRQLADVRTHQLPALSSAPSADALRRAEADVRAELARADAQAKELVLELPDAVGSAEQQREWTQQVQRLAKDVEALRGEFRTALLAGRRAVASEGATAARRELGLDSSSSKSAVKGDDKLATASSDVTTALQRTVASMSAELEKSSYSSALLDESSSAMQGISTEYTSFGDMLRNSGTLIRSMERADLIDAAILAGAALFFVLCIAYILKVRVWDRGVGILSFFWRFISLGRSPGDVKEKYQLAQDAASAAKASAKESSISASKSLAAAAAATAKDVASSASASLAASKSMAAAAASTAKDAATSATASLASSAKAASESASASLSSAAEAATPAVTRVTDVLKAAASTAAAVAAAFDMGGEDAEEIAEAQEDLSGGMAEGTWGVITDDDEDTEEKDREERLKESAKHIEL